MNSEENLKQPNDLTELKAMIVKTGLTLPEQQERAARMALTNPELIAFGTVASVALKCSVSPPPSFALPPLSDLRAFATSRHFSGSI
ncbi:MurR/RpiR family transcriptional regulator [Rhizobium leguminosarum]|uniref:MurR/RpiR family transcriptional regulator n=1 Tax=Rhizobium leguminosarum TaxID=384 RepID=UPI003F9A560C